MTLRALLVGLVAAMALSGCVSTVSGAAVRNARTVPSDVPRLDEAALNRVVLPVDEINDVMGTTGLAVTSDIADMTDSAGKVSDPDCLGAMFGAEEAVYKDSGWTAVRDVVAREPEEDNEHWVEQTVVLYPDSGTADRFLARSQSIWSTCAQSSLAVESEGTSSLWEFGEPSLGDGLIVQMAKQEDADGWECQHALAAASNMTAETWACGYSITDQAATMAIDIVNRAADM
ncbi:hypothetical protein A5662_18545 [Mycobacteriaceae bacterium 1482268.1]|nr:hypothetical protein A5662_18545 [Mycobacteriaceae bacterium 1482268.1]